MSKDEYPRAYIYRQVVRAKHYVDIHYAENIDLGCIAGEAYFSRYHFLRLFKTMYGMTPQQYRRRVRIEHAKTMLQRGVSVTEACFDLGFESLSAFSTSFKAIVGIRPSVYASEAQLHQESERTQPLKHVPGCFAEKFEKA